MRKSQELYKKAKRLIPGGTQLLSKRPEISLPELWPAYYSKAKGCQIWDLDSARYTDMGYMGIGSCILGYADRDVDSAVKKAIDTGGMSTLNAPEEVELAELLIRLHPWAHMVRYARTGGEAMAIAVRIARAFSRKDTVLFCGYHGWHDWYLSANLSSRKALDGHLLSGLNPLGVPRRLQGTSIPFRYNDTKGLLRLVKRYGSRVGIVVLESVRNHYPKAEFIQAIRDVTRGSKIVLIIDEISAGFRLNTGGAHLLFGLEPDIAVFAKGMSNGYPMAAIIGKRRVMERAQDTFISSTYWTDRIGPAAALATIKKMQKKTPGYLSRIGELIQDGWREAASRHGVEIEVSGIHPLGHFVFASEKPLVLKTLYTQLMLERGVLASTAFCAPYARTLKHVELYLKAAQEAFHLIAKAQATKRPESYLKGPVCHSGFERLT